MCLGTVLCVDWLAAAALLASEAAAALLPLLLFMFATVAPRETVLAAR